MKNEFSSFEPGCEADLRHNQCGPYGEFCGCMDIQEGVAAATGRAIADALALRVQQEELGLPVSPPPPAWPLGIFPSGGGGACGGCCCWLVLDGCTRGERGESLTTLAAVG